VQSYRESALGPQIERLVHVIAAEQGDATPTEWIVRWPSLWQMSPNEEATYRKSISDTDVAYINAGVVTPEEVAVTRFAGGGYSDGPVQVDLDLRQTATTPTPEDEATAYPANPSEAAAE
jgi:hypothetical protein